MLHYRAYNYNRDTYRRSKSWPAYRWKPPAKCSVYVQPTKIGLHRFTYGPKHIRTHPKNTHANRHKSGRTLMCPNQFDLFTTHMYTCTLTHANANCLVLLVSFLWLRVRTQNGRRKGYFTRRSFCLLNCTGSIYVQVSSKIRRACTHTHGVWCDPCATCVTCLNLNTFFSVIIICARCWHWKCWFDLQYHWNSI